MAHIVDSYSDSNGDFDFSLDDSATAVGQSFTGDGGSITSAVFPVSKVGSPTGSAYAKLYAHSGTFGTSSVPAGSALATSDAVDVSAFSGSYSQQTFTFSVPYLTTDTTKYVIVLEYTNGDGSNLVNVAADWTSPSHAGSAASYEGSWSSVGSFFDLCFYVNGDTLKRYWVGGTNSWNATAGTKWADTSGGTGGASVPTSNNNVYFDSNSGAGTVTINANSHCLTLDCTGFTGTLEGSSSLDIAGSMILSAGMTYEHSGAIFFDGTGSGYTIDTGGQTITSDWFSFVDSGSYTLTSALTGNSFFLLSFALSAGAAFNSGNYDISVGSVSVNGGNTVTLGTSTLTVTSSSSGIYFNGTMSVASSTIIFNGGTTNLKRFRGTGKTFGIVTIAADNVVIEGNNTINTLNVNTAGLTTGLKIAAGSTQTITNFTTNGSAGNLALLISDSAGTPGTLSKSSGTISVDYMSIKDSTATGGATWYAGNNSTNVSGNTGWLFIAPTTNMTRSLSYSIRSVDKITKPMTYEMDGTIESNNFLEFFIGL